MKVFKITILLLFSVIYSCENPFATREPEPPSQEQSTWIHPTLPSLVIDNLKYSIIEANTTNYIKCLIDSNSQYKFIPDAFVNANNPGFFDYWDLSSEQNYITKLFAATYDSARKVSFYAEPALDYQDSVQINVKYDLEIHHNLTESYAKVVEGQAELWLKERNGEWFITRWIDYGIGENPSWSSLKANFGK